MEKQVTYFYLVNLIITLIFAVLFGGILGSIKGNELIIGMLITMGVQLSLLTTSILFRKKYKVKKTYNYKLNKNIYLAIIIPIIIFIISSLILNLFNIKYVSTEYKGVILIIAIITTIIGSISEEIGWRGTLLEVFNKKYSLFKSSLLVGILWGMWHFFKISSLGFIIYLIFIPFIILLSIIITYLYKKSNKSLLVPIIFHSFINLSSVILIYNRECVEFYLIAILVSLLIIGIIYIVDKDYFKTREN